MTPPATRPAKPALRLGLRANLAQFSLLVAVNALVGGMLGQERTVLSLLAEREFGLAAYTSALTFILAFGATKAATNYVAGTLSDRYGRKPVLVAGWLIGLPVPLLLIWAPSWGWVVAANVLLGVNQGLTWSTTVIMKIDLVGRSGADWRWGSTRPLVTSPSPPPRWPPATSPLAMDCGPSRFTSASPTPRLGSACPPWPCARLASTPGSKPCPTPPAPMAGTITCTPSSPIGRCSRRPVSASRRCRRRRRPGWSTTSNDGLAWGLFPVLFAAAGLSIAQIGVLAALYPAVWGLGQLVTSALSDRAAASR